MGGAKEAQKGRVSLLDLHVRNLLHVNGDNIHINAESVAFGKSMFNFKAARGFWTNKQLVSTSILGA